MELTEFLQVLLFKFFFFDLDDLNLSLLLLPSLPHFPSHPPPFFLPAGMKEGGQALLGGLDALVSRNFFGAQADSFEATLPPPKCLEPFLAAAGSIAAAAASSSSSSASSNSPGFRAVFIRAPAVLETGAGVEVLAELELTDEQVESAARSRAAGSGNSGGGSGASDASASDAASIPRRVAVAVRQGNLLATSFHPELTDDSRWHALFAEAVREARGTKKKGGEASTDANAAAAAAAASSPAGAAACKLLGRKVNLPADLPVLAPGQKY